MPLKKHVFRATLSDVAQQTQALRRSMPACLSEEEGYAIELGIAEVLTNIVKHGYAADGNGTITLCWEEQDSCLQVEILDTGLPIPAHLLGCESARAFEFDPQDVAHLPQSGLGLALVKTVFDAVDYDSVNGVNRMRLRRTLCG